MLVATAGLLRVSADRWRQTARIRRDALGDEVAAAAAEREAERLDALVRGFVVVDFDQAAREVAAALATPVSLDDTSRCPDPAECESCGGTVDLGVVTIGTPLGVYCAPLCDGCIDDGDLPRLSWPNAVHRVGDHAGHLGIDVDQMAALMEAEEES